ncbi:MAG: hypothetical protein WKF75_17420 [Singulisphaera sp.]
MRPRLPAPPRCSPWRSWLWRGCGRRVRPRPEFELVTRQVRAFAGRVVAVYGRTPPADRIIWEVDRQRGPGGGSARRPPAPLRRRRVTRATS